MQFIPNAVAAGVARPRFALDGPCLHFRQAAQVLGHPTVQDQRRRHGEVRWKEYGWRIWIQAAPSRNRTAGPLRIAWTFDAIGIKLGITKLTGGNAAMPDAAGLVRRMLKTKLEDRFDQVLLSSITASPLWRSVNKGQS
jgi:hypothetical protein